MKKRFILIVLTVVLLSAAVVPILSGSKTAEAWWWTKTNPVVACDVEELEFSALEGINPSSQSIGVWNDGDGMLWWRVSDDASWLKLWPSWGVSRGETDGVTVKVDSKGLPPGEYEATIKISSSSASNSPVTVAVYLEVAEPEVIGPIMLGLERFWAPGHYDGVGAWLLTGEGGLEDLTGAGMEIKDTWALSLEYGEGNEEVVPILDGALSGSGEFSGEDVYNISGGILYDIGALIPGLGENWVITIDIEGDPFMGVLLSDLEGMLEGIPELMELLSVTEETDAGIAAVESSVIIPLDPIMELLPDLLPVMGDLLPALTPYITPILGIVPPIIVIMPQEVFLELMMKLL